MPPCAAFECDRTGWTLARIPTDTPSSAAASAARCPARPAPITSTSWEGILLTGLLGAAAIVWQAVSRSTRPPPVPGSGEGGSGLQRPRDLLDRHHAAQ